MPIVGNITSSITYPAEKIANGSSIFGPTKLKKLRMGYQFSQINSKFAKQFFWWGLGGSSPQDNGLKTNTGLLLFLLCSIEKTVKVSNYDVRKN